MTFKRTIKRQKSLKNSRVRTVWDSVMVVGANRAEGSPSQTHSSAAKAKHKMGPYFTATALALVDVCPQTSVPSSFIPPCTTFFNYWLLSTDSYKLLQEQKLITEMLLNRFSLCPCPFLLLLIHHLLLSHVYSLVPQFCLLALYPWKVISSFRLFLFLIKWTWTICVFLSCFTLENRPYWRAVLMSVCLEISKGQLNKCGGTVEQVWTILGCSVRV